MAFEVKIIADSVSPAGKRITTVSAKYPRIILAEVNTHRMLSKSSASSRAIPWRKMKMSVTEAPFVPIHWGEEQSGMQTGSEIPLSMHSLAEKLWLEALSWSAYYADLIANIGKTFVDRHPELAQPGDVDVRIHKSIPNRLLEPWMYTSTVITGTEWKNMFSLRCHPAAEVHFRLLAMMIREAMDASVPKQLEFGQWHLPYVTEEDSELDLDSQIKVSVARCARVSYLNHEGKRDVAKDIDLHSRLFMDRHAGPFEHQASPLRDAQEVSGNFYGWLQYRKTLEGESVPG